MSHPNAYPGKQFLSPEGNMAYETIEMPDDFHDDREGVSTVEHTSAVDDNWEIEFQKARDQVLIARGRLQGLFEGLEIGRRSKNGRN